jgi:8-oxo-dGTP diphosphatase
LKRGNVWLGVSGIVEYNDRWLVVKKTYSGLKGKWSFPAGFVDEGETVEEAIIREIYEETGIEAVVTDIIGIRSGVIKNKISDNLILFQLKAISTEITIEEREIETAAFFTRAELAADRDSSLLVKEYATQLNQEGSFNLHQLNPGDHFGYSKYSLFKK